MASSKDPSCLKLLPARMGLAQQTESSKQLSRILAEGPSFGVHCIVHGLTYSALFEDRNVSVLTKDDFGFFENICLLKGADASKMFLQGVKTEAPEKTSSMVVLNAKVDGEKYEQCKVYADVVSDKVAKNQQIEVVSKIFDRYRYR